MVSRVWKPDLHRRLNTGKRTLYLGYVLEGPSVWLASCPVAARTLFKYLSLHLQILPTL